MKITRTSVLTGKTSTREIAITEEELARWKNGELLQKVVPHLSADDREFLISGITPEEWEAEFADPIEEDYDDALEPNYRDKSEF